MFDLTMFHEEKWERTYEIEEVPCDSSSVMSGRTSFSTSFSGSTEASKYLGAVKEVQKLTENLENLSKIGTGKWQEVVEQAHKAFQTAMGRQEEEFAQDGGVLHLTESVVRYMVTIGRHGEILNELCKDEGWLEVDPVLEEQQRLGSSCTFWPIDCYLHSIACDLESILDSKSKLYEDISLQQIFLMNNIHYMVEKVRRSKLKHLFGDEWICEHVKKVQRHATTYKRITSDSLFPILCIDDTERLLANMYFSWPAGSLTVGSKSLRRLNSQLSMLFFRRHTKDRQDG
ncbi:Exocyst complex subunit Exo70, C-terminal [Dillenia turbinata]|uniref:Exocyst subunit Exo70 family protein n=1 Tax=Dillenia turbinata TaxID=194707 RepID=A0AAN8V4V4_9MAGN